MTHNNPIYAVIRYPTHKKAPDYMDFTIYTKQTSNKEKMVDYYKEIKAKYPSCTVHLVTREKAQEIKKKWHLYCDDCATRMIKETEKNI